MDFRICIDVKFRSTTWSIEVLVMGHLARPILEFEELGEDILVYLFSFPLPFTEKMFFGFPKLQERDSL